MKPDLRPFDLKSTGCTRTTAHAFPVVILCKDDDPIFTVWGGAHGYGLKEAEGQKMVQAIWAVG